MTRSASIFCSTPRPPQAGQAPNGLLNENSRGSISGMVKPDTGQANFSENSEVLGRCVAPLDATLPFFGSRRQPLDRRISTTGQPIRQLQRGLETFREALRHVGPHHDAVHHHVDVVLELLVERGGFGDLVELAVDLDAAEAPFLRYSASSLRYSPLRPRITGASR